MLDIELKPCPFCGGPVRDLGYEGRGPYITQIELQCDKCGVDIKISQSYLMAMLDLPQIDVVDIWNRRPKDEGS